MFQINFSKISKKILLLTSFCALLPSLSNAAGPYAGNTNQSQLIDALNANPVLLQKAKNFMLTNFSEITQLSQQLPMFLSSGENRPPPKKVPLNIGKARGTISRNLRPLNSTLNSNNNNSDSNDGTISITEGREFTPQSLWNTWADGYYFDVTDHRYNLDLNGRESLLVIGADKLVENNIAIGLLLSFQNAHSTNFGGNWIVNSHATTVGPYFAYQITPRWVINTSLGYGYTKNNLDVGIIDGNYIAQSYSLEVDLGGQYNYGAINLRYKPTLYYSYIHNKAYALTGATPIRSFSIPVASDNFALGLVSMLFEVNKNFNLNKFKVIQPFAEIGVNYQYLRPNNGQILTGNLLLVTTSAWSGMARLGVRIQMNKSLYIETNAAYLSIGHPDLNIWQGRMYLSYSF